MASFYFHGNLDLFGNDITTEGLIMYIKNEPKAEEDNETFKTCSLCNVTSQTTVSELGLDYLL